MNRTVLYSPVSPPWPTPVKRAPLPPFPQPITYDHVLPFTPPKGRALDFYRGNFCGLRITGAPAVPGSNAANPELVMACLLDNYPRDVQIEYLTQYAEDGYTHLQRSVGHALHYGSSLQQYIDLSKRAQQDYGLFCDHWLIAEESPGFAWNQDGNYWQPILQPIIDQLLAADAIDSCCPCWQLDKVNQGAPGNPTISLIAMVANALPCDVPLYTHWMNEALAWWKTGGEVWQDAYQTINVKDRFSWWLAMQPYLTGGYHQGNTTLARTDPTTYQGKLRDTLNPFNNGRMGHSLRSDKNFALVEFECTAQDQFDGSCSEDEGDLVGYILTCTKGDNNNGGVMGGYGNGARQPDGSPL